MGTPHCTTHSNSRLLCLACCMCSGVCIYVCICMYARICMYVCVCCMYVCSFVLPSIQRHRSCPAMTRMQSVFITGGLRGNTGKQRTGSAGVTIAGSHMRTFHFASGVCFLQKQTMASCFVQPCPRCNQLHCTQLRCAWPNHCMQGNSSLKLCICLFLLVVKLRQSDCNC